MTPKQRILSAIKGQPVDRVPWSPFLAYYWENLPESEQKMGQLAYLQRMGADPLLRGFFSIAEVKIGGCEFRRSTKGKQTFETYDTPVGSLTLTFTRTDTANTSYLTGHPVKTAEDFKVLMYLTEHTELIRANDKFERDYKELGEAGLVMPTIGVHGKTAFQSLVERWCGTEALTYALCDFPEVVEECLQMMWEKDDETVRISVDSSVEALLFYEDSSTTNISPRMFEQYTAPELRRWAEIIHKEDKLLVHHACGHIKDLLPLMAKTGVDAIESISPPPTGNIDLPDAIRLLPENIALIGGIEPLFFRNCALSELEARARSLISAMQGRRFVLANSDSCPPDVSYDKFELVSRLVREIQK